jgi:hypothetical protein
MDETWQSLCGESCCRLKLGRGHREQKMSGLLLHPIDSTQGRYSHNEFEGGAGTKESIANRDH